VNAALEVRAESVNTRWAVVTNAHFLAAWTHSLTNTIPLSLPEGRALIDAGEVKPLATMGAERLGIFPDVPTLGEATGTDWTVGAWRVVAGPAGLPDDVVETLIPALERAYGSPEFQEFMEGRGFGMIWRPGAEAAAFMQESDEAFGKVMSEAGIAAQ
jgi:tripartite-type tricarboxylate transporter receptor subunit TctC